MRETERQRERDKETGRQREIEREREREREKEKERKRERKSVCLTREPLNHPNFVSHRNDFVRSDGELRKKV